MALGAATTAASGGAAGVSSVTGGASLSEVEGELPRGLSVPPIDKKANGAGHHTDGDAAIALQAPAPGCQQRRLIRNAFRLAADRDPAAAARRVRGTRLER